MRLNCWILVILFLYHGHHQVSANGTCDLETIKDLGIGLATDQIPYVGGTINKLLEQFWPSDCAFEALKRMIGDMIDSGIDKERERHLRLLFHGFNDTLQQNVMLGELEDVGTMYSFYMDLNNAEPFFTKNTVGEAVVYFREFVTVKITIIRILEKLNPVKYKNLLKEQAKKLVKAGEDMIAEVPKLMKLPQYDCVSEGDRRYAENREKVKKVLSESLEAWRSIYTAPIGDKYTINDWDTVGLRFNKVINFGLKTYDQWVSCWVSGSYCRPRTCPGEDGPRKYGDCRGERFWIVNNKGGPIKTCDTVGLRYSYQNGKGYWLSNYRYWVNTMTCPGKRFDSINTSCRGEKWTIRAAGKECGQPLEHLDEVSLQGHYNTDYLLMTHYLGGWNLYLAMNTYKCARNWKDYVDLPATYLVIFKWGYPNIYNS